MKKEILLLFLLVCNTHIIFSQTRLNDDLPSFADVDFGFQISDAAGRVVYLADSEIQNEMTLFSVPLTGGVPTRLNTGGSVGGSTRFMITLDGMQVVYIADQDIDGVNEVYVVPIEGGTPTKLNPPFSGDTDAFRIGLTSDGTRVVYAADPNQNNESQLFAVPLAGGTPITITGTLDPDISPSNFSSSGDGSRIVYAAFTAGNVVQIFTASTNGGEPELLHPELVAGGNVSTFKISPDGTQVLYQGDVFTNNFTELFIVPVGGGTSTQLSGSLDFTNTFGAFDFNHRGDSVIFRADSDGDLSLEIHVVPSTGGTPLRLTQLRPWFVSTQTPVLTGDGSTLIYRANEDSQFDNEIFSVPLNGSSLPVRINDDLVENGDVSFFRVSNDDSRVIYVADQDTDGVNELYSVPINGGASIKLNAPLVDGGDVSSAQISNNSMLVYYTADQEIDGVSELYVVPITGGTPVKLNGPIIADGDISRTVLPADDSRVIYMADQIQNDVFELFTVSPNGGDNSLTWGGLVDSDWQKTRNWDKNVPPSELYNITIADVSSTTAPLIVEDQVVEVNDLTISAGGMLTIENDDATSSTSGGTLIVNGGFLNEATGLMTIESGASVMLMGSRSGAGSEMIQRNLGGDGSLSIFGTSINMVAANVLGSDFIFGYDPSAGQFTVPTEQETLAPGKGYFIGSNASSYAVALEGALVSGEVDVSVTDASGAGGDAFNLVANPYAAAIDLDDFLKNANNTANTTGVVYLWDDGGTNAGGSRGGDYITVNSMGTVGSINPGNGVSGSQTTAAFNGNIPSNQGFFIEATQSGMVSFTPEMQVSNGNADLNFFRSDSDIDDRSIIKLSLSNSELLYDELLVGLDRNATYEDDYSLDAKKLVGSESIAFYSLQNDEKYAIAAIPNEIDGYKEIPLAFDIATPGNYQIRVRELLLTSANLQAFIHDQVTDEYFNLSTTQQVNFRSGTVNQDERFRLLFSPNIVTSIDETSTGSQSLQMIAGNSKELILNYDGQLHQVMIHDLNGREVLSTYIDFSPGLTKIPVALKSHQLYVLSVGEESIKFLLK